MDIAGAFASLVGTAVNAMTASDQASAERRARRKAAEKLLEQKQITETQYDDLIKDIDEYYATRQSLGNKEDISTYRDLMKGYDPDEYVFDLDKYGSFDIKYDKTKEDFLNPYYNQIIGDTAATVQNTAAGKAMGHSTGAANAIAKAVAQKEDELYKTALNEYNIDRNQSYKEYSDYITRMQEQLNAQREGKQYQLQQYGNLANDYLNTQDQYMRDLMQAKSDKLGTSNQYAVSMASLY